LELIRKYLKNTQGFTLVEVLLALTIFAIGIIPIYQMIVSSAKVQNVAEETYQATLHSQALLQDVNNQIEIDVGEAYEVSRQLSSKVIEPWLDPTGGDIDSSLVNFLKIAEDEFNEKYDTENYLYEVHIWPMENGKPVTDAISFIAYKGGVTIPGFTAENTSNFTQVEIKDLIEQYFQDNNALIWAGLGEVKPIGIGEVKYKAHDAIEVTARGIEGYNIVVEDIAGEGFLGKNIKLIYKCHDDGGPITHELIVGDMIGSVAGDIIQLSVDLTTFPSGIRSKIIRIENRTSATLVVSAYNEKNEADIQIYPIQQAKEGRIIVEERAKLEPFKNFIVGIIVKDANNITFGEPNKVLGKIVDIYSFDYNKQKRK